MENSKGFAPVLHKKVPNPLIKETKVWWGLPHPQSRMSNRINSGILEIPVLESFPHPPTQAIYRSRDIIRPESRELDFFFKPLR